MALVKLKAVLEVLEAYKALNMWERDEVLDLLEKEYTERHAKRLRGMK